MDSSVNTWMYVLKNGRRRMATVTVIDDTGDEIRVLIRPTYSRHQFKDKQVAIRCAMFEGIKVVPVKWLPVFTEWWDEPDYRT